MPIDRIKNLVSRYQHKIDTTFVVGHCLLVPLSETRPKINVKIRIVDNINDLEHVMEHHGKWYSDWAQKRLDEGNLCFGADYNGKIVSTVWTSFDDVYLPYVEYNLNAGEGIIPLIGGWSSPDFRGQGIYPCVWNECCKYLIKEKSAKRAWAFIQPSNIISFKVHRKFYCDRVDMIIRLRKLLGVRKHKIIYPFKPVDTLIDLENLQILH